MASPTPVAINALNLSTPSVYGGDERSLCEGPRIVPVLNVDFSVATTYTLDYSNQMKAGRISRIQTVFVDASAITGSVAVVMTTGQQIVVKGGTQGYFYCLAQEPFKVSMTSASTGKASFIFCNFTIEPAQWSSQ